MSKNISLMYFNWNIWSVGGQRYWVVRFCGFVMLNGFDVFFQVFVYWLRKQRLLCLLFCLLVEKTKIVCYWHSMQIASFYPSAELIFLFNQFKMPSLFLFETNMHSNYLVPNLLFLKHAIANIICIKMSQFISIAYLSS